MMSFKKNAKLISLYRKVLRTARTWPKISERRYIIETAQYEIRNFKIENKKDVNKFVENAIIEGENRLAMAIHYGSPYARMDHLGGGGAEGITHFKENAQIAKGRKKINMSGHSKWFDGSNKRDN